MESQARPTRKRKARTAYLVLAGVAGAVVATYYAHGYLTRDQVSTDDAQVDADITPIAARTAGVIAHLRVTDHERVTAGQVIAELDPTDDKLRVAAARAGVDAAIAQAEAAEAQVEIVRSTSSGGLSSARAQVQGSSAFERSAAAQVEVAAAALARATAELAKADADLGDATKLHGAGAVSGQALDLARTSRETARAAVAAAEANVAAAREQQALSRTRVAEARGHLAQSAPVDQQVAAAVAAAKLARARVASARATLALAESQLGYATVTAPHDGFVSRLAAREGQLVQSGTTLLMLVPATTYVVANFKETQIDRIQAGDPVDIEIDALDRTLHGTVASISPGTGARFSLMPPDNATGNFVKVVQRVPVKIRWSEPDVPVLRAGLSVEVTVHLQP